ncbi:hypothetical protein HNP69_000117 [Chryseobacterium koreense]|nr:hypothetical protein [Chryseobacterium koreense]
MKKLLFLSMIIFGQSLFSQITLAENGIALSDNF